MKPIMLRVVPFVTREVDEIRRGRVRSFAKSSNDESGAAVRCGWAKGDSDLYKCDVKDCPVRGEEEVIKILSDSRVLALHLEVDRIRICRIQMTPKKFNIYIYIYIYI